MFVVFENDNAAPVQIIPVLYPREEELLHSTVAQFISTEEFGHYVEDGEVCESGIYVKVYVGNVGCASVGILYVVLA